MRLGATWEGFWLGLLAFLAVGCDDCREGKEGCPCFGNQTCNGTLACRSDTCVNLKGNSGSDADGNGANVDACVDCAEGACSTEVSQCEGTSGCEDFVDCLIGCGVELSCQSQCTQGTSAEAQSNAVLLTACAYVACPAECAGSSSSLATGSVEPASSRDPGSGDPGSPPGGTPTSGGTPGTAPEPETTALSEGTNWLVLDGETAPGAEVPNSLLGIEGVFYAYGDDCATYTWDATSRCITGTHCTPSAENWGVGIGFDFYNDGTQKTTWSASTYGVRGVAWSVSNSATFQVWLTNMDPSHGATCAPMADCGIPGPPDGYSAATSSGTMYFNNLSKDDWGGTGVAYTFDPTRLLSIQFKLPSSSVDPEFSLCVSQLGMIR